MDLKALNFDGKSVWVTGAYQGIGQAVAAAFAERGATVFGLDKQYPTAELAAAAKGHVSGVRLDVTVPADMDRIVTTLVARHGSPDVLVNAAGVLYMGSVDTVSPEAWHETFAVNVHGVYHLLHRLVPLFKERRRGTMVTIASNATHVPRTQMAAYGASKAALNALCQSVALDLAAYGVRCNIISPGSTETPMQRAMWQTADDGAKVVAGAPDQFRLGIPLGKLAQPEDVAHLAVFLASDLAGHITLQDIVIDGGATLGA